jgi:hypothetical protein
VDLQGAGRPNFRSGREPCGFATLVGALVRFPGLS